MSDTPEVAPETGRAVQGSDRPPAIWGNVPPRNPRFTGREQLLDELAERLSAGRSRRARHWAALSVVLLTDREEYFLQESKRRRDSFALTRTLLRTAEDSTDQPSITAASAYLDWFELRQFESERAPEQFAEEVRRIGRSARVLLGAVATDRAYEFRDHPPPHASSPCGVIRFAAPLIPRAPGSGPAFEAPFSKCVLAA